MLLLCLVAVSFHTALPSAFIKELKPHVLHYMFNIKLFFLKYLLSQSGVRPADPAMRVQGLVGQIPVRPLLGIQAEQSGQKKTFI